jgi:hypothetical protein
VTGVVALQSKWAAARRDEEAYLDRYVTVEQRTHRPALLLPGCFVAHRLKTTAGIRPLRFAHPAKFRSSATTPVTDLVHESLGQGLPYSGTLSPK